MTILQLIQLDGFSSKKAGSTGGGEYAGPCPWCGGDDRFRVWPSQGEFGKYWCRGCGRSGDAIQYLRDHRRMTYQEACQHLGREVNLPSTLAGSRPAKPQWEPRVTAAPGDLWQARARKLVDEAVYHLWTPTGKPMLDFLIQRRGLIEKTIREFSLGLVPLNRWADAKTWGVDEILKDNGKPKKYWIPRGLTIPLCQEDQVLRVRVRRPKSDGDPRYYLLRGSNTRAMVLGTVTSVSVLVESEIDALLLHQEAGDLVNVISLGNAQSRPDQGAAETLNQSQLILVSLDADQAGATESWRWWKQHYPQARRWPSIQGKDPGEMWAAGVNIRTWVEAGLIEYAANIAIQPEPHLNLAAVEGQHVIEEHRKPAPPSPPATCESCPWYELNPWTHYPDFGAWCHYRMEHLLVGSATCEEFRRGEVPLRQNHERVPHVQSSTSPAPQEHVLTCADCPHFEVNYGPNPRQG